MKFAFEPYKYELLYRPLYEFWIAYVWIIAGLVTRYSAFLGLDFPQRLINIQFSICLFVAAIFFAKGFGLYRIQRKLFGTRLELVPLDDFIKRTAPYVKEQSIWLGEGFKWTSTQTQRCYEMFKRDWASISEYEPFLSRFNKHLKLGFNGLNKLFAKFLKLKRWQKLAFWPLFLAFAPVSFIFSFLHRLKPEKVMGQRWLHGLELHHDPITIPASWFNGHLLILGTTGSGKTRLADLLNTQCIMRGEALVIIDPKGDIEMRDNAKRACDTYRKHCLEKGLPDPGERFYFFHPAYPEGSVRLNLLANSARDTDISTRITNLIPSENGSFDPFTAFGWMSINAIVQALLYIGENPTINSIKMHLLNSMEDLTDKVVELFCTQADEREREDQGALSHEAFENLLINYKKKNKAFSKEDLCTCKCEIFNDYYATCKDATNIAALVKLRNHPREHFSKMINNMLPLLDMLTVGTLGTMLSMSPGDDPLMEHKSINTLDILDRKGVLYIGLDSLSDKRVGTAIGSLALSDIAASAGTLYNYRQDKPPVNIFVDEAAECVNDAFIQILNKGRGAGYRLMVATQTISDFVTALGSKDKAEMVLGNVNNKIALRTTNVASQEYLCNGLPETALQKLTHTQGINSLTTQPFLHGANQSEQLKEESAPLIAQQVFGMLPNLEYVGIFGGSHIVKGKLPIIIGSKTNKKATPTENKADFEINFDLDQTGN